MRISNRHPRVKLLVSRESDNKDPSVKRIWMSLPYHNVVSPHPLIPSLDENTTICPSNMPFSLSILVAIGHTMTRDLFQTHACTQTPNDHQIAILPRSPKTNTFIHCNEEVYPKTPQNTRSTQSQKDLLWTHNAIPPSDKTMPIMVSMRKPSATTDEPQERGGPGIRVACTYLD